MAEDGWIMVRVRQSTHARLEAVRQSLWRAHEQGKIGLELDARGRVSLDQVVSILLDARKAHSDRRANNARKRRTAKRADVQQLAGDLADVQQLAGDLADVEQLAGDLADVEQPLPDNA